VLTLPPTGADSATPLYFALAVLAVGALVVTVTTRRRTSH
jgi:LPXTG-motif cell wall-anchored protein